MRTFNQLFMVAACLLTIPATMWAQKGNILIGAHGGVNISKLCCGSMVVNKDYQFGEGPAFGLTSSYGINKWLSITAELNYATQGGRKNGMQAVNVNNTLLYADFDNRSSLRYLELPVMARATFGKQFKYYAELGIFGGYLLSAQQKTTGSSRLYLDADGTQAYVGENNIMGFESDKDIRGSIKDFNYGLTGGIGIGYTFGRHGLWLDGRYVMGIPNIREQSTQNGENSTGSIMALVGYTFQIH